MKILLYTLLALAALLAGNVTGADEPRASFRLGVVNERPQRPDHMLEQMGPLHRELSARLAARGIACRPLVIAESVPAMARHLRAGTVDAVVEGVMPTLALERRTGAVEPSLLVWRKGQRQYYTVFFVRKDSPVASLGDLTGRTVAFEAPRSTSAFYVPLATLTAHGLEPVPAEAAARTAESVPYVFADSELNQAYWVQRGKADAGAFNDGDWERTPAHVRDDLRIIYKTQPLPRWLLSFRSDTAQEVRRAVIEVLLEMHRDATGRAALQQAERIARFEHLGAGDREVLDHWRPVLERVETRF